MEKQPYQNKLLNPELENKAVRPNTVQENVKHHAFHLGKRIEALKKIAPEDDNIPIMEKRHEEALKFLGK